MMNPLANDASANRPSEDDLGRWANRMMALVRELYPICRSITGDGVRHTLDIISREIGLERHEIPTGTQVFDWEVPLEWNIRDAWIKNRAGERVVDFQKSSLHVVSYSMPIRKRMTMEELRPHLHCLPDKPDWVPHRTSCYEPAWGFCLSQHDLDRMQEAEYEVCIDATLKPGSLSLAECLIEGARDREVLFCTHICHPALCNDNLSGIAVTAALANVLKQRRECRYSYRFLFVPSTIGSLAWLAANQDRLEKLVGGMALFRLGDSRNFTYKRSFAGDSPVDRAAAYAVAAAGGDLLGFHPFGHDERQFNAAGSAFPWAP